MQETSIFYIYVAYNSGSYNLHKYLEPFYYANKFM